MDNCARATAKLVLPDGTEIELPLLQVSSVSVESLAVVLYCQSPTEL